MGDKEDHEVHVRTVRDPQHLYMCVCLYTYEKSIFPGLDIKDFSGIICKHPFLDTLEEFK